MKPEEIKARKEWFRSMHLRPVYLVEEDGGMVVGEKTGELQVYIAIAPTNVRGRGTPFHAFRKFYSVSLGLIPVNERRDMGRFVSYKNRGCIFPWDDIELATDIVFKTKVAEKREELKNLYGEWMDETDDPSMEGVRP